jgi:hypothetical protein
MDRTREKLTKPFPVKPCAFCTLLVSKILQMPQKSKKKPKNKPKKKKMTIQE